MDPAGTGMCTGNANDFNAPPAILAPSGGWELDSDGYKFCGGPTLDQCKQMCSSLGCASISFTSAASASGTGCCHTFMSACATKDAANHPHTMSYTTPAVVASGASGPTTHWLKVFTGVTKIERITVTNRLDCCSDRLGSFTVYYQDADTDAWVECGGGEGGDTFAVTEVACASTSAAKGVMVEAALDTPLQIAEVEVFGFQLALTPQSSVEVDLGGKVARRVQIFLSAPAQDESGAPLVAISELELVGCEQYIEKSAADALTYSVTAAPTVTRVTPSQGSSAGNTGIQIDGTGWAAGADLTVEIAGVTAVLEFVGGPGQSYTGASGTVYTCPASESCAVGVTGFHGPTFRGPAGGYVTLTDPAAGTALASDGAFFSYVDLWSSPSAWDGLPPPVELDTVVIPAGQHLVLDYSPPRMYMIIVFGSLTFARADLHLRASYIFVHGGTLTVGTEQQPFEQQATITLYGNPVSQELPIYGAKLIACRECTLDLHGKPVAHTWTTLAAPTEPGATVLRLMKAVDWPVGATIVVASTEEWDALADQQPTDPVTLLRRPAPEKRTITAISADGTSLTVEPPLLFAHMGETRSYTTSSGELQLVELRAEVALLSRNVRIEGDGDSVAPALYGAHLMLHSIGHESLVARIENIEMHRAGQYARKERHPINFHRIGHVEQSYVRSNSMHNLYYRAVQINDVSKLRVHNNVIYDVVGHAVHMEKGTETKCTISDNLVLFTREAVAGLNTELTPAAFLIANLDNYVSGNAAGGGIGFGYWISPTKDGVKGIFGETFCPHGEQALDFSRNTAHSNWMGGLFLFSMQGSGRAAWQWDPPGSIAAKQDPCAPAGRVNPYLTNSFDRIVSWRNKEFGIRIKYGAAQVVFDTPAVVENSPYGIELGTRLFGRWGTNLIKNAIFDGGVGSDAGGAGSVSSWSAGKPYFGLRWAHWHRMTVDGAVFANFFQCGEMDSLKRGATPVSVNGFCSAATVGPRILAPGCLNNGGGWETRFKRVAWENTYFKVMWRWAHEAMLVDLDGTFTEWKPSTVIADSGFFSDADQVFPECSASSITLGGPRSLDAMGKALHGVACEYNFVRVVVGMPPVPWWDSGPPPLHISVGSESSNGASGTPPSNLDHPVQPGSHSAGGGAAGQGLHVKKEDAAYFVDKWRPLSKTWDKAVPLAAYGDYLIEINAAAASSASAAAFPISVAGGGQKFLYGDGIVGAWVDDASGARNFRYLKATVLTPTRFNASHKDTVLGVMSDDRSAITWQTTHLAGFGTWIKCSVDTSRCTGPIRYGSAPKIIVKDGYKRWPYVNKGYHFLVPTNKLYDVQFESKNPKVAPLDLATIQFTVGEMGKGEWLGWRSKPQYCYGDAKTPCTPEQYKGFDMHVALEHSALAASPLPYRKVNPFSPRHYSSLASYSWEDWESDLKSLVTGVGTMVEQNPTLIEYGWWADMAPFYTEWDECLKKHGLFGGGGAIAGAIAVSEAADAAAVCVADPSLHECTCGHAYVTTSAVGAFPVTGEYNVSWVEAYVVVGGGSWPAECSWSLSCTGMLTLAPNP